MYIYFKIYVLELLKYLFILLKCIYLKIWGKEKAYIVLLDSEKMLHQYEEFDRHTKSPITSKSTFCFVCFFLRSLAGDTVVKFSKI